MINDKCNDLIYFLVQPDSLSLVVLNCLREYYDQNVPDYSIPPILLRSQVYYSCLSRTDVDRELVFSWNSEIYFFSIKSIKLFCILQF